MTELRIHRLRLGRALGCVAVALLPASIPAGLQSASRAAQRYQPTEAERAFVMQLDSAWSTGKPERVLRLFDFVHPQARMALRANVLATTGGRGAKRRSTIVAAFALERDDNRQQRALFLRAEVELHGKTTVRGGQFDVLVFTPSSADHATRPRGLLLARTTRDVQRRVDAGGGKPIGRDFCTSCQACNFRIGAPARGNWAIIAKPQGSSGVIDAAEIYALDFDMALEFGVHGAAITATKPTEVIDALLGRARTRIAAQLGQDAGTAAFRDVTLAGLHGRCTSLRASTRRGARRFDLYGFAAGAILYTLCLQAPAGAFKTRSADVRALLSTFQRMDATHPDVRTEAVVAAHGGPGKFAADRGFAVAEIGLEIPAPAPTWRTALGLGAEWFQAKWTCPTSHSMFVVSGTKRPMTRLTMSAARAWLGMWKKGRACATGLPEFVTDRRPKRCKIGAHEGWEVDYSFRATTGRSKGFLIAIPHGDTIISLQGRATPGARQDELLALLHKTAHSLRLAGL